MKTSRFALALILLVTALAVAVAIRLRVQNDARPQSIVVAEVPPDLPPETASPPVSTSTSFSNAPAVVEAPEAKATLTTNKLERLAQIRETFRQLAAGDKLNAMRAAKQIADDTERETALLTLVTEWTQGELGPARLRAERIARVGLEAGIGMELAKHPELALLWADEMTEGDGRANVLQVTARFMVNSDPAAAFALSQQFPEANRRGFSDAIFSDWASRDTEAALKWAEQYSDLAEREAAIQAIRTSAPVGIGAVLSADGGYPIIQDLVPGTPAERSGQLKSGDRIIAIAQAGGPFWDMNQVPLKDVVDAIRGAPNTMLQLKVVPGDATPNTPAKTVIIVRDQVKFKK